MNGESGMNILILFIHPHLSSLDGINSSNMPWTPGGTPNSWTYCLVCFCSGVMLRLRWIKCLYPTWVTYQSKMEQNSWTYVAKSWTKTRWTIGAGIWCTTQCERRHKFKRVQNYISKELLSDFAASLGLQPRVWVGDGVIISQSKGPIAFCQNSNCRKLGPSTKGLGWGWRYHFPVWRPNCFLPKFRLK